MNYTQNYHLPQWVETDRILRTDFNDMASAIDAALKTNADGLSAETAARESAVAAKGNCRIVCGSYVGDGLAGVNNKQTLTFPAKPMLVAVLPAQFSNSGCRILMARDSQWTYSYPDLPSSICYVAWGEDSVSWWSDDSEFSFDMAGRTYCYVALLAADA